MKDFSDFRDNWLTDEKEAEISKQCIEQTETLNDPNDKSFMATFSATYSLLLLAEYHEWLKAQKD